MFVFPTRIAPASRSTRARPARPRPATSRGRRRDASLPGQPRDAIASFTVNGTPASGAGPRPAAAARARVEVDHDRVQRGVPRRDPRDVRVEDVPRGDPAVANSRGDLDRRGGETVG